MAKTSSLSVLPGVDTLLARESVRSLVEARGHEVVVAAIRAMLDRARERLREGGDAAGDEGVAALFSDAAIVAEIERRARPSLRPVLNATGVVLHTNLGRAPLSTDATRAVTGAAGASAVEMDLPSGRRGARGAALAALGREVFGCEDLAACGNGAAAVMLVLTAIASGREVIVSRGELVEIGGGFRIPEVLRASGCRLVEVGTTNRTRASDYQRAAGEHTAALLRVHRSNFSVEGFTESPTVEALAAEARRLGVPLVYDLGSGLPREVAGLAPDEPTARAAIRAGADIVCISGDKLLGGPQAGLVLGRAELVSKVRRHPLMRAVRAGKLTLAALEATLRAWRDGREDTLPVVRMLRATVPDLAAMAEEVCRLLAGAGVPARLEPATDAVGGGSAPATELPGMAVVVDTGDPAALAARLRKGEPAVVPVVRHGAVWLHLRTIPPEALETLARAVTAAARP